MKKQKLSDKIIEKLGMGKVKAPAKKKVQKVGMKAYKSGVKIPKKKG